MCFCCCCGAIGNVGQTVSCVVGNEKETAIFYEDCLGVCTQYCDNYLYVNAVFIAIKSELCLLCLYFS